MHTPSEVMQAEVPPAPVAETVKEEVKVTDAPEGEVKKPAKKKPAKKAKKKPAKKKRK